MNSRTNVYAYVQAWQNNEGIFITKQKLHQSQLSFQFSLNEQRILLTSKQIHNINYPQYSLV